MVLQIRRAPGSEGPVASASCMQNSETHAAMFYFLHLLHLSKAKKMGPENYCSTFLFRLFFLFQMLLANSNKPDRFTDFRVFEIHSFKFGSPISKQSNSIKMSIKCKTDKASPRGSRF